MCRLFIIIMFTCDVKAGLYIVHNLRSYLFTDAMYGDNELYGSETAYTNQENYRANDSILQKLQHDQTAAQSPITGPVTTYARPTTIENNRLSMPGNNYSKAIQQALLLEIIIKGLEPDEQFSLGTTHGHAHQHPLQHASLTC